MIGGLDSNTFMVRLLFSVIGSAFAIFLCVTCYDVRHQHRLVQAYVRRKAESNAAINSLYVCDSSRETPAAHWLEHGNRDAQPQEVGLRAADAQQLQQSFGCIPETALDGACSQSHGSDGDVRRPWRFQRRSLVDPTSTSAQHARVPAVPLFGWRQMTLSGPLPSPTAKVVSWADNGAVKRRGTQVDANRFTSPPLVVLATGGARVATIRPLQQRFMQHSVVFAATAEVLKQVLLEAAELRKIGPHPSLLRLCAVVTDQPCGEVGLLSELTTGPLATLLDTSPIQLTWANGLLALATDVASGLVHLHGLGL